MRTKHVTSFDDSAIGANAFTCGVLLYRFTLPNSMILRHQGFKEPDATNVRVRIKFHRPFHIKDLEFHASMLVRPYHEAEKRHVLPMTTGWILNFLDLSDMTNHLN